MCKKHLGRFLKVWKCICGLWSNQAVLIVVILGMAITLVLWIIISKDEDISALLVNLLAGFIASFFTIVVIERIAKKRKIPLKLAQYREVQLFTVKLIDLWALMYNECVAVKEDILLDSFFTEEHIMNIYKKLDLEAQLNTLPKQDWFTFIEIVKSDLEKRGNCILDRYQSDNDPELFRAIHHTVTDSVFLGRLNYIKMIQISTRDLQLVRLPCLYEYLPSPKQKDFDQLKIIFEWCRTQYNHFHKKDDILQITRLAVRANNKPLCALTDEKISKILSTRILRQESSKPKNENKV